MGRSKRESAKWRESSENSGYGSAWRGSEPFQIIYKQNQRHPRGAPTAPKEVPVYQLTITLTRIEPPVWRRLRIPGNIPLGLFHKFQETMGWRNMHLHRFVVAGRALGPASHADEMGDEDLLTRLSGPRSDRLRRQPLDFTNQGVSTGKYGPDNLRIVPALSPTGVFDSSA